jgi:hypothetical protein
MAAAEEDDAAALAEEAVGEGLRLDYRGLYQLYPNEGCRNSRLSQPWRLIPLMSCESDHRHRLLLRDDALLDP